MREVQIRRREKKSYLPVPVVAQSIKILGSIYSDQGPLKGVDGAEEKELLSRLLGIDKDDDAIFKAMREFWLNLRVKIPSEGVVLNITTSTETVNGKKVEMPVNINDYLIYKWALRHKYVAKNYEELEKNSHKQFYIYDPNVEELRVNKSYKIRQKAYTEIAKIGDDFDKLRMVLSILEDTDISPLSDKQVDNKIGEYLESDPAKVMAIATDKNIEMKALIAELVSNDILNKIGNQLYFIEQKLGDTTDEAVLFLRDKKNSEIFTLLKAKLKELRR